MIHSAAKMTNRLNAQSLVFLHSVSRVALLLVTCVVSLFALSETSFSVIFLFCLFGLIGFLFSSRGGTAAANLFLFVYATGAVAALLIYYIYMDRYGVPYYIGGSDDLAYEVWAQDAAEILQILDYGSIRGTVVQPWHNSVGYVYLVSLLYRLGELFGGFHTMVPRLFNAMCLGILAVFTYRLTLRLRYERQMALTVGLFTGLLPIMMYNAVHTFRDVPVALLLLIGVYVWTPNLGSPKPGSRLGRWGITLLLALFLAELRFYQSIVLFVVAFVGDVFVPRRWSPTRRQLYMMFAMIVTAILLLLLREEVTALIERLIRSQERYEDYRGGLSSGLAAFVFTASPPLSFFLRMGYALISPLPVLTRNLDQIWLSIGTIIHFLYLPFLGLGLLWAVRHRFMWPVVFAFTMLFAGMAFITFTGRHIVQYLPYGILLAAIGYRHYRYYRAPIFLLVGLLGMGLLVTYIFLK